VIYSEEEQPEYESNDCTGQAYTEGYAFSGIKTNLIRTGNSSSSYGIVQDSASSQTKTMSSVMVFDEGALTYSCVDTPDNPTSNAYAITPVSLPFTMPVTTPLKF
jgi:hypothetical protein